MGFLKNMKGMQEQAQQAMAGAQSPPADGGAMYGMGADMQPDVVYMQLANKLQASGVEAPGVIHAMRPTGKTDFGGGQEIEFEISIKPATGDAYPATVKQSMLPAQLEGISEGQAITVKYDPDAPVMALIYGW